MDNERPNERTSWSQRLEEPGALPGLTDRERAWDKLYDRLKADVRKTGLRRKLAHFPERRPSSDLRRRDPSRSQASTEPGGAFPSDNEPLARSEAPRRRRRMIWCWTVAACLLLIVIPAALFLKDGHRGAKRDPQKIPVAVNTGDRHDHSADNPGSRPDHIIDNSGQNRTRTNPSSSAGQSTSASSNMALSNPSRQAHPTPTVHPSPGHPSSMASNPSQVHRPDLNMLLARTRDTLTLVFARPDLSKPPVLVGAASKPPKKELRVVHINELQPWQPTPAMAIGQRRRPGALHIELSEEPLRPSTTFTGQAPEPIISPNEHFLRWPLAAHQNP